MDPGPSGAQRRARGGVCLHSKCRGAQQLYGPASWADGGHNTGVFHQVPSQQRLWRSFCTTGWGGGGSFSLDFVTEFC